MAEQSVILAPGESKVVSFEATPHEAKVFQVSVDGLSGSFVATEEVIDFDLTRPTVSPETITPGTASTITCPVTSRCTRAQTVTAKVIIYEGSILPGHGTIIATKTSAPFSISPGQTYNVIVHHTAIAGTIDRRDVEVEVYIAGKLIKQSEWDDVYYVTAIGIVDTTWSVSGISGTLGGMLVKATVTVSSPSEFRGKITVSIPESVIASNKLLTPEQQQALIAYYEQKWAECTDATCRHTYEIVLERVRGDPMTGGFYDSKINGRETREEVKEHHINHIAKGVASRTFPHMAGMYFDFPAGTSQIVLGFFMKADEAHYRISDGATLYCIGYKGGVFSPEVKLYEESTLVDDVIYTDAISFSQWYTGNRCTLPWGAYPVSASVPATVKSGDYKFWASHTVYLTYMSGYEYFVQLYVPIGWRGHGWVLAYRELYCGTPWRTRIIRLPGTGEFTFEGILGGDPRLYWDVVPGVKSPAAARYIRARGEYIELWEDVPPGTYPIYSECVKRLGPPSFAGVETIWNKDTGVKITVV